MPADHSALPLTSVYRERPSTRISGVVLWESVATGAATSILPDGCMDVILLGEQAVVAGADTVARPFTGRPGMRCVGARFAPGLLPAVLGVPADEIVDRVVSLDRLGSPLFGGRLAGMLADRVLGAADPLDGLDVVLAPLARGADDTMAGRVAALLAAGVPVADVAATVGYSPRQLQRRSARWFGYGPKHLAAVCRLQRALALGRAGMAGGAVACAAGYADQAHLARESRRLGGAPFNRLVGR